MARCDWLVLIALRYDKEYKFVAGREARQGELTTSAMSYRELNDNIFVTHHNESGWTLQFGIRGFFASPSGSPFKNIDVNDFQNVCVLFPNLATS
jgi:hypothetical protein